MNVEIAQRLAELRREKGYSQEELAENLGLSRQAVSKWERAESSPDTGNLIALAKLYGVTLDDLLRVDADIEEDIRFESQDRNDSAEEKVLEAARKAEEAAEKAVAAAVQSTAAAVQSTEVAASTIASSGKQPEPAAGQGSLSPGPQPAPAQANPASEPAQPNPAQGAAYAQAQQPTQPQQPPQPQQPTQPQQPAYASAAKSNEWSAWKKFPYPILCVIVFFLLGAFGSAWHPAWVVFLTIPLYYWFVNTMEKEASGSSDGRGSEHDWVEGNAYYYDADGTVQGTASVGSQKKPRSPWMTFPYPILCVIVFLLVGLFAGAWHPAWVIFLTIPLYYWIAHIIINDPNYRK